MVARYKSAESDGEGEGDAHDGVLLLDDMPHAASTFGMLCGEREREREREKERKRETEG